MDTHGIVVNFGKHKGTLLTRVPLAYLKWMINNLDSKRKYYDIKSINKIIAKNNPGKNPHESSTSFKNKWCSENYLLIKPHIHFWFDLAKLEILRRNGKNSKNIDINSKEFNKELNLPKAQISPHAIDRASLKVLIHWLESNKARNKHKKPREGLHTWLIRITLNALEKNDKHNGKYYYMGMKLVIEKGNEYPILKTIMSDI